MKKYMFSKAELEDAINFNNKYFLEYLHLNGYLKKNVNLEILQNALYTVVIMKDDGAMFVSFKGGINLHKLFKENAKCKEEKRKQENLEKLQRAFDFVEKAKEARVALYSPPIAPPWEKEK